MKVFVWGDASGVNQFIPAYNDSVSGIREGETEEAFLARIRRLAGLPDVAEVKDSAEMPQDRTFRRAWVLSNGAVRVDMPKAREAWRDRLRAMRAPKLNALDIEYQRADEVGDLVGKQGVIQRKRALRDVTQDPRIESASTPEELKNVIPEVLK